MAQVVKGRTTVIPQPLQEEARADGSEQKTLEWEGVPAGIETQYAAEKASGDWDSVRLERGKVVSRVVATVDVATDANTSEPGVRRAWWELDRNMVDIPLAMHPYFSGAGYLDVLRRNYIDKGVEPGWNTGDLAGAVDVDKTYYYHRINGVESVPYSTYVLRQCRLVSAGTLARSEHSDVMSVVRLPANVPSALLGSIPATYEWLKQPPDVRQTERYRYQLTQEYWGGMPLWSIIYGGTWNPQA